VDGDKPDQWEISFDGERLEVADPADFSLPPHDRSATHLLEAAAQFGRSVARTELVVGGPASDAMSSELTALVFDVSEGKPPTAEEMRGWFSWEGKSLEVAAMEKGGADIIAVHEATPRAWGSLVKLRRQILESGDRNPLKKKLSSGLNHDDLLRVVLPVGKGAPGRVTKFHMSEDFARIEYGATTSGVGLQTIAEARAYGFLASFPYPPEGPLSAEAPRQTADAVAVAAQVAAAANRARAVVLIREPGTMDHSEFDPDTVRGYLDRLQVPLFVWSVGRAAEDATWGESETFASQEKFMRVTLALREAIDRQVVIWVRGRYLAHEIDLSSTANERLRRVTSTPGSLAVDPSDLDFQPWIAEEVIDDPAEDTAFSNVNALEGGTEPSATADTFAESVEVRLVNVEAVVDDRSGAPVYDLDAAVFELLADQEPVEIRYFDAPSAPGEAGVERSPDGTASAQSPAASTSGGLTETPANLVVFLDLGGMDDRARKQIAKTLSNTLAGESGLETGYRTMLVTYDRGMKIETPLTAEPLALREILARIESGDVGRSVFRNVRAETFREIARVRAGISAGRPNGAGGRAAFRERDMLVAQLSALRQELSQEVRETVRALRSLTSGLGGVDGRRILVYVGSGLELTPGRELFEEAERTLGLVGENLARLRVEAQGATAQGDFDALLEDAMANDVTLFTLVPPVRRVADDVEATSAASVGFAGRGTGARQEIAKDAACLLSTETGGTCQVGAAEPALLLEQARTDLSATYNLAFEPAHAPDGQFHEIEVRLLTDSPAVPDGATVRHRRGFTDALPGARARDRLTAALVFGQESNPLDVRIEFADPTPTGNGELQLVPVELRIPVERLGVLPLENGTRFGADARLLVVTRDAEGRTTSIQEFPVTFQFDREKLENTDLQYAHKVHLTLSPGEHDVAIGLWDSIGNAGSFVVGRVPGGVVAAQ